MRENVSVLCVFGTLTNRFSSSHSSVLLRAVLLFRHSLFHTQRARAYKRNQTHPCNRHKHLGIFFAFVLCNKTRVRFTSEHCTRNVAGDVHTYIALYGLQNAVHACKMSVGGVRVAFRKRRDFPKHRNMRRAVCMHSHRMKNYYYSRHTYSPESRHV